MVVSKNSFFFSSLLRFEIRSSIFMEKRKSIALHKILCVDHFFYRDIVARISIITTQEKFDHFVGEISSLLEDTRVEKYCGESSLDGFPSMDMFTYPLALWVDFKFSIHPIFKEMLK